MTNEIRDGTAYGAMLLRISLGFTYVFHSVLMVWMTSGHHGTAALLEGTGLPGPLAYAATHAVVIGGTMLILGVQSRWVALALSPVSFAAVWAHLGHGWNFSTQGSGWECSLYLLVLSVVQVLVGDGAYALSPSRPLSIGGRSPSMFG
jgi:putative oxidoreductase